MTGKSENRAFVFPLKSALSCTICVHSDKEIDRTCTGCLLGKSNFKRKTDKQIALMGLKMGEGGVIYRELAAEIV